MSRSVLSLWTWFALSSIAVLVINLAWIAPHLRDSEPADRRGFIAAFVVRVAVDSLMVCGFIALLHLALR